MQYQSNTRTVTSKTGLVFPCILDQSTDLNLVLTAAATYYRQAGCAASWATVYNVADAMRDGSAVIVLYIAADGEQTARCLWPTNLTLTKDNNITARCYCPLRKEWKTFRLDRMHTCHPLTTPDDAEPAPAAKA